MQAMSVLCRLLNSCKPEVFGAVEQFQLMPARNVGVAFYARADQELSAMQFRLVRTRSIWCRVAVSARAGKERWCCLLCSCRPGALMSPFMLVRIRSVVPCSLGSCRRGASCPTV
ncbi:hypothetical protein FF1_040429 [Malus domestica]